jgi:hypothetical protein
VRAWLVVVAAGAALAAGPAASGSQAACTPGVKTVGGVSERVFCGPAKATVHYGSKVFTFTQGECDSMAASFAINIGTVVLGTTKNAKPDYFGLVLGDAAGTKPAGRDGAYVGGVLALDYGGKGYLVQGTTLKITLSGGRSRGMFSGNTFLTSPTVKVKGTFSC